MLLSAVWLWHLRAFVCLYHLLKASSLKLKGMVFGGRSDVTCLESDATSPFPHATTIAKYLTLWHWIIGASMQDNERFCWLGHAKKPPGTYNFGMHLSPSQNLLPSTGQTDTEKLGIPGHAIHLFQCARQCQCLVAHHLHFCAWWRETTHQKDVLQKTCSPSVLALWPGISSFLSDRSRVITARTAQRLRKSSKRSMELGGLAFGAHEHMAMAIWDGNNGFSGPRVKSATSNCNGNMLRMLPTGILHMISLIWQTKWRCQAAKAEMRNRMTATYSLFTSGRFRILSKNIKNAMGTSCPGCGHLCLYSITSPVNRNPNLKYFLKASMCTGFNVSTQGCCCDMVNFWMADIDAYVPLILQVLAFKDQTQALRSQTKVAGQLAIFVHILEKGGGNLGK